jgi:two-component system cell cycle sensor histidine kinase/response regulator CckA
VKSERSISNDRVSHGSFESALSSLTGIDNADGLIDLFVDSIPAILGIQDNEHTVLRYNRSGYEFFGVSPEEVRGKKCYEVLGRDSVCDECVTQEALMTGKPSFVEKYVPDLNLWLDVRAYPVLCSRTGKAAGVIEHFRDITRSKQADQALTWSEIKHRHLIQTMQEGLIEQTGEKLTFVNDSFCRMSGYGQSELVGKEIRLLFDDENWTLFCTQQEIRKQGLSEPYEIEMLRKDGSSLPVYVSPYAEIHEGRLVRSSGVVTDISLLKQAEREKHQLTTQIQYAQKLESLGVLAGGIAHDFNNLLMTVLGNADLVLCELPETSPVAPSMKEIVRAARQASDLANQMLEYAGKGDIIKEPMDLNEVVASMIRLMKVSFTKRGSVELDLDPGIPCVLADPTQLRRIVMNLLTNAFEAIDCCGSSIRVSTSLREFSSRELAESLPSGNLLEGEYVSLEVSDDGCGIDEGVMNRLFDPFFTTKRTGRGLGLAVLLGIVGNHGGSVLVKSIPGEGSRFTVILPAHTLPSNAAAETEETETVALTAAGSVLIIDDEASIRDVGSRMLEKLGLRSASASDLDTALEYLGKSSKNTSLIIVDHSMPGFTGNQLIRALGSLAEGIPIVVSSGFSSDDVLQQYEGIDVRAFLHKPYGTAELAEVISGIFRV